MKIRLLTPQRIMVHAGTVIDVEDDRGALFVAIGAAEIVEPVIETAVERLDAETPEKPKRTRKKG